MHGLMKTDAVFVTVPPSGGCYGRVFALGIDDNRRSRPETEIIDDNACAFAAARAAYKADVPVVTIAEG
jgi:hypothetical protein